MNAANYPVSFDINRPETMSRAHVFLRIVLLVLHPVRAVVSRYAKTRGLHQGDARRLRRRACSLGIGRSALSFRFT
jgi:hypothetical protein